MDCRVIVARAWRIIAPCGLNGATFIEEISDDDEDQRVKLIALLDRIAVHGPRSIPTERNHPVDNEGKLRQLRVDHLRVIYFYDEGRVVVCANCYTKKSAKTPPREIAIASKFRSAYLTAKANGTLKLIPVR